MNRVKGMRLVLTALVALLGACGGGGGGDGGGGDGGPAAPGGATPSVPSTGVVPALPVEPLPAGSLGKAGAARLLTQGSFGPTISEIERVATMTPEQWVDEQLAAAPSYHLPECRRLRQNSEELESAARTDAWWQIALTAPDQLRQRVAFALSQILVVSDQASALFHQNEGLCLYYDMLVRNAFGNYRELLEEATLSPIMGRYLSMLGNAKPDPATGRRADENYARELMQLFTVGLVQLRADGTPVLDAAGQPLPTYTQADIEGLARTLTGWAWAGATRFEYGPRDWLTPMQAFEAYHDTGSKTLLGGAVVPAGGSARADLELALDTLFAHPNVGPFIGRQLIQKLVTSNPSPDYVARVAAVFADNGQGRRGDLGAVVRAVLLDAEAREGLNRNIDFGKLREPLLRQSHLWRALQAQPDAASGRYSYRRARLELGQSPLQSPSVFNFYSPGYAPPGAIRERGLVAPEYQLANEASTALIANRAYNSLYYDYVGSGEAAAGAVRVDLRPLLGLAADSAALVEHLDLLLTSAQLDTGFKSALADHLDAIPAGDDGGRLRVQDAVYLILTSPQYQIQR